MTAFVDGTYMTLTRHEQHIDVHCRDCDTVLHSSHDKPMRAANEAEVQGWRGVRRAGWGMICPDCPKAPAAAAATPVDLGLLSECIREGGRDCTDFHECPICWNQICPQHTNGIADCNCGQLHHWDCAIECRDWKPLWTDSKATGS